ncbi:MULTISPECIES: preprotein translocase subunit SecG [Oxalobacteraceae]|uniref:preprotein translocase subunit SecG n=1 Tax=Oxalobacteraceae TaxID=75682 RepID=UPI0002AE8E3C|nr:MULTISPECIES: preprotein translocase subunit SecG [Oxalobacteraceae]ELX09719.1 preprotein translocase subunit SecG [Janthinobacterium sp. HH01]OEZ62955.1 protein-export membrane protein SecG [Duganella sp. HH105]OFA05053.1 protein-export membrane protein SecG [Duganella sp. HH101]
MNSLFNLVIVVQVVSAIAIIGLVLLQHGKGADMGAAFGSGASGSLFGATGSSNFMSKSTGVAAAIFFSATLALSYISTQHSSGVVSGGVMDKAAPAAPAPVPATGAAAIPTAPAAAPAAPAAAPAAPAATGPAASIPK